jgi:hypothetical protein
LTRDKLAINETDAGGDTALINSAGSTDWSYEVSTRRIQHDGTNTQSAIVFSKTHAIGIQNSPKNKV